MNLPIKNEEKNTPLTTAIPAIDKWCDPFIQELHEVRAKLLAKANGDMHQIVINAHQTAVRQGFAAD